MKNLFIILTGFLVLTSCDAKKNHTKNTIVNKKDTVASTTKDRTNFESTVIQVIKAFQQKDANALNQLIHKEKGLIIMHNPGAFRVYEKTDKIDFDNPIPEYQPYNTEFETDYQLKYEQLPNYDCETESWNKSGLFCDTITRDNRLSSTLKALVEFEFFTEKWDWDTEISAFEEMEKNSRMIILSSLRNGPYTDESGELLFSLTLINGKWYLTFLDRVVPCSA